MSDGVNITLNDIYAAVVRTESKVDLLTEKVTGRQGVMDQLDDHKARIRILEAARWPIPAVTAIVAIIALGWQIIDSGIVA